jgi:hypothetical protein
MNPAIAEEIILFASLVIIYCFPSWFSIAPSPFFGILCTGLAKKQLEKIACLACDNMIDLLSGNCLIRGGGGESSYFANYGN